MASSRLLSADRLLSFMRNNKDMLETFKFVEDYLEQHPCIDGPGMQRVLTKALPHLYAPSGSFPLSFNEANALDHYFFKTGRTGLWRRAFGYPETGAARCNGVNAVVAVNVGMFTFDFEQLD